MSTKQQQAIWELCRQGYQLTAEHAAQCWNRGEPFALKDEPLIARPLERLIDQCNWEIERALSHAWPARQTIRNRPLGETRFTGEAKLSLV